MSTTVVDDFRPPVRDIRSRNGLCKVAVLLWFGPPPALPREALPLCRAPHPCAKPGRGPLCRAGRCPVQSGGLQISPSPPPPASRTPPECKNMSQMGSLRGGGTTTVQKKNRCFAPEGAKRLSSHLTKHCPISKKKGGSIFEGAKHTSGGHTLRG